MRKVFSILAFVSLLTLSMLLHPQRARAATNFTWSQSADTVVPQYNNIDVRPAYLTDTSGFWEVYSDGSNAIHRFWGTSLDNMTEQPQGHLDSSWGTPYGERYWIGGAYTDLHTWYATVHVEFDYHATPALNFNWFRKISLATSTDKGLTWHYAGDIIFSDQSTNINDFSAYNYFQNGPGDQYLFADWRGGYFYCYYTTNWVDKVTGERWQGTRVARSPISAKLAPGSWTKWYQGSWSQPGIGGKDSDVFLNEDNAAVSYDSYLGEYIAIGHSTNNVTYITTATDLSQQNWQPLTHFVNDNELYFYNWVIDSTTYDPFTLGQIFRVYSAQNDYNGVPTKYMTITLQPGINNNPAPTPQVYPYPYTSVPDFNPGWQRSPDQPPGTVINAGFEVDPNIPTGWQTWPYVYQTSQYHIYIVGNGQQYSGNTALEEDATWGGQTCEQTIDVLPNTTYTLSAMIRSSDGSAFYLGVKNYGGNETNTPVTTSFWSYASVTFTTGASNTTARIYLWHPSGGAVYADAVQLLQP